jgi:hypothetical protein
MFYVSDPSSARTQSDVHFEMSFRRRRAAAVDPVIALREWNEPGTFPSVPHVLVSRRLRLTSTQWHKTTMNDLVTCSFGPQRCDGINPSRASSGDQTADAGNEDHDRRGGQERARVQRINTEECVADHDARHNREWHPEHQASADQSEQVAHHHPLKYSRRCTEGQSDTEFL